MNSSQRPDSFEAVDYTGVLRRRWWVVLAVTVVCLLGAVAYVLVAAKSYTATTAVYVAPTGADQTNQVANSRTAGGSVNLDTEAQLVTSGTVATIAGRLMHSPLTPYQLSKQVSVTVPPNSQTLNISCHAPKATAAATCAQDFATAYLRNRSATAAATLAGELNTLNAKMKALQKTEASLTAQAKSLPSNSPTAAADLSEAATARTQLNALTQQAAALTGLSANTAGGHIITNATPPGKPTSPSKTLVLPSGLVAGLLLGLIAAFVWDRRDKRLHSADDVERLLGVPVLLSLPAKAPARQISLASPRSRTGKAFTGLAYSVAASLGEGSHVVLVTGGTPGPGVSVVAANLAAALARTHSEAVLVCADLRSSVATEIFGLADSRGLAELVAGRATVSEVARGPASVPGLWVIPPGADTSLADYQLQHDTARALTTQLRRDARYVVIEAQATEDGTDTFALAEFADTAVLTIEANRTRQAEASDCIRRLNRMRTPLLGAAVIAPVSANVSIRPPQQGQPRVGPGHDNGRDAPVTTRTHSELSALTSTTPATREPGRPVRTREGHGDPADRIPGR